MYNAAFHKLPSSYTTTTNVTLPDWSYDN